MLKAIHYGSHGVNLWSRPAATRAPYPRSSPRAIQS